MSRYTLGNHKTKTPIRRHPCQPPTPAGFEQGVPWSRPRDLFLFYSSPRQAKCPYAKLPKASNGSKLRAQGMQNTSQKKGKPKTVRSQPFHMVPKMLATDPKRPHAATSRARASQKRCVRNPSTRCRNCSFEAVKKNIGKGP